MQRGVSLKCIETLHSQNVTILNVRVFLLPLLLGDARAEQVSLDLQVQPLDRVGVNFCTERPATET